MFLLDGNNRRTNIDAGGNLRSGVPTFFFAAGRMSRARPFEKWLSNPA